MPRWPGSVNKVNPKRARSWKRRTQPRGWTYVCVLSRTATTGGQGVGREAESGGFAEKHRAVVDGGHPDDEPVGQREGKVEPALWGRRRSYPPLVPRCLRMARCGRLMRDPRRTRGGPEWRRVSNSISIMRNEERCPASSRTAE